MVMKNHTMLVSIAVERYAGEQCSPLQPPPDGAIQAGRVRSGGIDGGLLQKERILLMQQPHRHGVYAIGTTQPKGSGTRPF